MNDISSYQRPIEESTFENQNESPTVINFLLYEYLHKEKIRTGEKLGEGFFSEVYQLKSPHLNQVVKILKPHLLASTATYNPLYGEHLALPLRHPHILETDHCLYIQLNQEKKLIAQFMPFYKGASLGHVVENADLSFPRIHKIAYQIATALTHLHAQNIIHGDLNPENILLNDQDQVKLIDFGLARSVDMKNGYVRVDFLAPECTNSINQKAEAWSFGMLLYYMLHKNLPKIGKNCPQVKSLVYARDDIPEDLENLLNKLLTLDPEKRISLYEACRKLRHLLA